MLKQKLNPNAKYFFVKQTLPLTYYMSVAEIRNLLKMRPWQDFQIRRLKRQLCSLFLAFLGVGLKRSSFLPDLLSILYEMDIPVFSAAFFVPLKESSGLRSTRSINRNLLTFSQEPRSPLRLKHVLAAFWDNAPHQDLGSTWFFLTPSCFNAVVVLHFWSCFLATRCRQNTSNDTWEGMELHLMIPHGWEPLRKLIC